MQGYVVFCCWLHVLGVRVVGANVASFNSAEREEATLSVTGPTTALSKRRSLSANLRMNEPRGIRGSSSRNTPEDEQFLLLSLDLPLRKDPQNSVSKDKWKMKNNAASWRERLWAPSTTPTMLPSESHSKGPSRAPSESPSLVPSKSPSKSPSKAPSESPSKSPSLVPSASPSKAPSKRPSNSPSMAPSALPSKAPSETPSSSPSKARSASPSMAPSNSPSISPSLEPSISSSPSAVPSESPSSSPTREENNPGYFRQFDRPIRIACGGDSLTRGRHGGVLGVHTYPYQLGEMLGETFEVKNFGRNAATAIRFDWTSYVGTEQFQASLDFEPDIYLLMLGTNDVRLWKDKAHRYLTDMEWIVNKIRRINIESPARVIVGIPPWVMTDGAFGVRNDILVNNVRPEIQKLATRQNLQLVNMYDVTYNQVDSFLENDGLHLNRIGYKSLALAWKEGIQCNQNGICETGESCTTCPGDCFLNCS